MTLTLGTLHLDNRHSFSYPQEFAIRAILHLTNCINTPPKFATPLPSGFIRYGYTTFQQQLFDIPKAQAAAEVQPYRMADDLHRKAVMLMCVVAGGVSMRQL